MKPQIKNIPKKIYLNLGFDKDELLQDEDFKDLNYHGEITWCEDKINDTDIEYTLKPVEPAKGLTDEEIEEWACNYDKKEARFYHSPIELSLGAKWARSRMQGALKEGLINAFNWLSDKESPYAILYGNLKTRFATSAKDYTTEQVIDKYIEYLNSKK